MMETERQQTVQSHVSSALALQEHLLVTNRPPNLPSLGIQRKGSNEAGFPETYLESTHQ
jgi:hypothetical protein